MARSRSVGLDRLAAVSRRGAATCARATSLKPLESKLPAVGTTIFTVMTQLAEQHDAVNLSQGFPDFQPPSGLIERVEHYLGRRFHQYAPMPGAVPLREAVATKLKDHYGVAADPGAEITITSGATEAIFCAIQA